MIALKLLLSPLAFAIGFLVPLLTQTLTALGLTPAGWHAWWIAVAIAVPFGLMAQFHGTWLGVKG